MRIEIADEPVVLPRFDAEYVVLAVRGRTHGEGGRGLGRLLAEDLSPAPGWPQLRAKRV